MYATCSPVQEQTPAARALYKSKVIKMQFGKTKLASIPTNIWNDPKFKKLSAPAANAQFLLLRIMAAPETDKIPGLVSTSLEHLAYSLGWSVEDTRRCWKEIEDVGMGVADWDAGLVWITDAVLKNPPKNLNAVRGWWRQFDALPKCGLLYQAWWKIGQTLALRGETWHEAFRFASDVIFAGAYSGDEFSDIHACFGNRIIDFSKFFQRNPPAKDVQTSSSPPPLHGQSTESPPHISESPPHPPPNIELFPQEQAPPPKKKKLKSPSNSLPEGYEKIVQALNDADKIAWDGIERKYVIRTTLGKNQRQCVEKILSDGFSIDDIVLAIRRKGEDAYRAPMYINKDTGIEHSNRALVSLEHLARGGKMDYYLRRDELDEHRKGQAKKNVPMTLEEHKKKMAENVEELKKSLSPEELAKLLPPKKTREEALAMVRSHVLHLHR